MFHLLSFLKIDNHLLLISQGSEVKDEYYGYGKGESSQNSKSITSRQYFLCINHIQGTHYPYTVRR